MHEMIRDYALSALGVQVASLEGFFGEILEASDLDSSLNSLEQTLYIIITEANGMRYFEESQKSVTIIIGIYQGSTYPPARLKALDDVILSQHLVLFHFRSIYETALR